MGISKWKLEEGEGIRGQTWGVKRVERRGRGWGDGRSNDDGILRRIGIVEGNGNRIRKLRECSLTLVPDSPALYFLLMMSNQHALIATLVRAGQAFFFSIYPKSPRRS